MDQQFSAELTTGPDRVYPLVADLTRYPEFLDIVHRVEPASDGAEGEPPAWLVTLRAKIGPFARSKRLRMVRTVADEGHQARFERAEIDGRSHSAWVLEATVAPRPAGDASNGGNGGSSLTMRLAYSGGLWSSALDGLLRAQVDRAATRLDSLAATTGR
ncbi:MAG: SRPBCC family protein [Acidimicrobiales bacterium]